MYCLAGCGNIFAAHTRLPHKFINQGFVFNSFQEKQKLLSFFPLQVFGLQ